MGGKMFACIGMADDGVSVKTPDIETATMLIEVGVGQRAPCFHRSCVRLPRGTDPDELRHRLTASYDLVRAPHEDAAGDAAAPPGLTTGAAPWL
ncbi:MmcQ/YjbR family DNA-binding protein [Rhodosalinus halophilus]|uniref:MmcQ/YjbR family DNA-binding protein n=1 Tax=Rhodosalinus halophilus TaxID=2259333 RepID=UPI0030B806B6